MEELIVDAVRALGPAGVGLLMLLENLFPPIPSEFIMPLAGYLASSGELALIPALIAGTVGSLAGATFWYVVGRRVDRDRLGAWVDQHGRWLTICEPDLERAEGFFRRHGRSSMFFGRLMPVVRTLISLPAGLSRVPVPLFLLFSGLGSALWTTALGLAGLLLGNRFPELGDRLGIISWIVIGGAVVWYLVRVVRLRPRNG